MHWEGCRHIRGWRQGLCIHVQVAIKVGALVAVTHKAVRRHGLLLGRERLVAGADSGVPGVLVALHVAVGLLVHGWRVGLVRGGHERQRVAHEHLRARHLLLQRLGLPHRVVRHHLPQRQVAGHHLPCAGQQHVGRVHRRRLAAPRACRAALRRAAPAAVGGTRRRARALRTLLSPGVAWGVPSSALDGGEERAAPACGLRCWWLLPEGCLEVVLDGCTGNNGHGACRNRVGRVEDAGLAGC
mmetsp:Transcript_2149/g.5453  ORF Transcript_2149/g.5453 Transcript_2149/m.5453 type:complete len:242 (+) Transcript_2149:308-1033(+)